jgi:hypothetical protein
LGGQYTVEQAQARACQIGEIGNWALHIHGLENATTKGDVTRDGRVIPKIFADFDVLSSLEAPVQRS